MIIRIFRMNDGYPWMLVHCPKCLITVTHIRDLQQAMREKETHKCAWTFIQNGGE